MKRQLFEGNREREATGSIAQQGATALDGDEKVHCPMEVFSHGAHQEIAVNHWFCCSEATKKSGKRLKTCSSTRNRRASRFSTFASCFSWEDPQWYLKRTEDRVRGQPHLLQEQNQCAYLAIQNKKIKINKISNIHYKKVLLMSSLTSFSLHRKLATDFIIYHL